MKKAKRAVLGTWRITGMEVWDADYFDMEAPAHITIRSDLTGEFQFGLVQGDLDARVSSVDGVARVEFSWSGYDENDPMSGRGWMVVTADENKVGVLLFSFVFQAMAEYASTRVRYSALRGLH